jgi:hypothetical protein
VGTAITSTFSLGGNQVVDRIERLLFDLALARIGSVKIDLVCNSCAYSQQTVVRSTIAVRVIAMLQSKVSHLLAPCD